jgi:hypothetical protein
MNAEYHQARYFKKGSLNLRRIARKIRADIPAERLNKLHQTFIDL